MTLVPLRPFPEAARDELADAQLRANLRHATDTIRAKRARVVSELPDWEGLREAGRARIRRNRRDGVAERLADQRRRLVARIAGAQVHERSSGGDLLGPTPVELLERVGLRRPHPG